MFNFLNSAVLIAAAAALIPLLIHLFSRRRVKIVPFSSLKHLKEMQKRQVRRLKIRQLLLLILRMLIVLVAVLAFARPATKGGYLGSHAGVSSVILFDRSASMQRQLKDGSLHDLSLAKAGQVIENFGQSDEVLLIPFDRHAAFPSGERFFSSDVAGDILSKIEPGYDRADLEEAFGKAVGLLAEAKNLNKEMYVISDRQLNSLPEETDSVPDDVSFYIFKMPVETDGNCGIVDIDMGGQLIEVGSEFVIKVDIQNYDALDKSELLASLFIDDVRIKQAEFEIDANSQKTVQFTHTVSGPGFHSGRVEISDDDFLPDNKYFFSFKIPEQFNVLIVDGDGSGGIVNLALVPSDDISRYWSVKVIPPSQLVSVRLREFDAVILAGVETLGQAETTRLLGYIDGGGGLYYILGGHISPDYFNSYFGRRLGLEIRAPIPENFTRAGYYSMERFDFNHPVFMPFGDLFAEETPTFRFYSLPAIGFGADVRCLAWFSSNTPAIVETGLGLGKIIAMTAPILPEYSDIAAHSFFVPLMIRTIEYLADDMSSYEQKNYIGRNIIRTVTNGTVPYETVQLIAPDNKSYRIAGVQKSGRTVFDCRPIDKPGIYLLKNDGRLIDMFPANIDPREGNLAAVDADRMAASLGIDDYKVITYDDNIEKTVSEARFGRELWKLFLWAVAVLLAVEMFLSREKAAVIDES